MVQEFITKLREMAKSSIENQVEGFVKLLKKAHCFLVDSLFDMKSPFSRFYFL